MVDVYGRAADTAAAGHTVDLLIGGLADEAAGPHDENDSAAAWSQESVNLRCKSRQARLAENLLIMEMLRGLLLGLADPQLCPMLLPVVEGVFIHIGLVIAGRCVPG